MIDIKGDWRALNNSELASEEAKGRATKNFSKCPKKAERKRGREREREEEIGEKRLFNY